MGKELLNPISPLIPEGKLINDSWLIFDLPALIEKLKLKHRLGKSKLNAMILIKSPERQIVLTALHEGTEIKSFQSNDSITFQIIEGKLRFNTRKKSITLDKGQLFTMQEKVKYSYTTKQETIFLVTIEKGTIQQIEN